MSSTSRFSLIYCFSLALAFNSLALAQSSSPGYIEDIGSTAEDLFDPRTGSFEEWSQRDDRIDWDADGDLDFDDFHILQWFASDDSEDATRDGFLDDDDFELVHWLLGPEAADLNEDGKMNRIDHALYLEKNGVFENAGFFVLLEPDSDQIVVEWETSQPGYNDTMRYRAVGETEWQKVHKSGTPGESDPFAHLIRLTGLQPDTEYEFGLRSISAEGLSTPPHEDDYEGTFRTRAETDQRRGSILELDVQTDRRDVVISWETNRSTEARYTLKTASDGQTVAEGTLDREGSYAHVVEIQGLEPATEYEATLSSVPIGASGSSDEEHMTDVETVRLTTRSDSQPVRLLFPPFATASSTLAMVDLTFNQPVRLRVDYARTDNFNARMTGSSASLYHKSVAADNPLRRHLVNLPDLEPGMTYRYRITAFNTGGDSLTTDPRGYHQWSTDWQFTALAAGDTLAPLIVEGPQVISRDQIAVVEWTTDVETTGKVIFGTQGSDYGTSDEFSVTDLTPDGRPHLSRRHAVTLASLTPGTAYQFRIWGAAANGKIATFTPQSAAGKRIGVQQPPGGSGSFVTDAQPDTRPPIILSGPTVTSRTHDTAVVEWTTDEPANSQVRFGRTDLDESVRSGENGVRHRLVLSNLEPATTYRYDVSSTDPLNNGPAQSAQALFTTSAAVDLMAPKLISEPNVTYKNDRSATIQWTTDELATGAIEFGPSTDLNAVRQLSTAGSEHEITLTNLEPATTYFYRVSSSDLNNNGPTQSAIDSFQTDALPDLTPPVLSGFDAAPDDSTAIVRWQTDELADSFVEFGTDSLLLDLRVGETRDQLAHEITLVNLTPGTRYFYRVGSIDRAGNPPSESDLLDFTTLATADNTPPAPPAGFQATSGSEQVLLSWNSNSEIDLGGYNLYRRSGEGEFAPIATHLTQTTYADLGLINGKAYEYQITAIDRTSTPNESAPGETASAQPIASAAPSAPQPLPQQGSLQSPPLIFANATPVHTEASHTNTLRVSTDSLFGSITASISNLPEGVGIAEEGKTAWTIDRELEENQTYYWQVQAVEEDILGPFSTPHPFITQRRPTLVGDFNGDSTVGFDDFFLFSDNFGKDASGDAAPFDLDGNGSIDFDDFFIFSDNFGKTVSGKRYSSSEALETNLLLTLKAEGGRRPDDGRILLRAMADQVHDVKAFGLVLRFDPTVVEFEELDRNAENLLERDGRVAPLLHVLAEEPGELVLANGITSGAPISGQGQLATLHFRLIGSANEVLFTASEAHVAGSNGEGRRVVQLQSARLTPNTYHLGANFPNPFNPSTSIDYALPQAGPVHLSVYDVLGRRVRLLVAKDRHPAGFYTASWDGRDDRGHIAASGVYFYLLHAGDTFRQAQKMVLVK